MSLSPSKPLAPDETPPKKISAERREQLTESLFHQAVDQKKKSLQALEAKIYRYEEPKFISKEQLQNSAVRQHDDEMARRKQKMAALEAKVHPPEKGKTMSRDEIEESVRRIYDDQVRMKKERLEKAKAKRLGEEAKGAGKGGGIGKTITKEEAAECGTRLCKPMKREFTEDEINAILFK